jgi:hypothetical protein
LAHPGKLLKLRVSSPPSERTTPQKNSFVIVGFSALRLRRRAADGHRAVASCQLQHVQSAELNAPSTELFTPPPELALLRMMPLALKDVRLALAEAEQAAVTMPSVGVVRDGLITGIARGLGWAALGLVAAEEAGLELVVP